MQNTKAPTWTITAAPKTCAALSGFLQSAEIPLNLAYEYDENAGLTLTAQTSNTDLKFELPLKIGTLIDRLFVEQKRTLLAEKKTEYQHPHFNLNRLHSTLRLNNDTEKEIKLTEKETGILSFLLENRGRTVSRKELLTAVWEYAETVETHTLETHIYRLRQKIEKNPSEPEILLTNENGYALK